MVSDAKTTFSSAYALFSNPYLLNEDTSYAEKISNAPQPGVTAQKAITMPPSNDPKRHVCKEMVLGRGAYCARMEAERLQRLKMEGGSSSSGLVKREAASPEQGAPSSEDPKLYISQEMLSGRGSRDPREEAKRLRRLEKGKETPFAEVKPKAASPEPGISAPPLTIRSKNVKKSLGPTMLVTVYYRVFFQGQLQGSEMGVVLLRNPKYYRLKAKLQRAWREHFPGYLDAPTLGCGMRLDGPAPDGPVYFDWMWKHHLSRGALVNGERPHLRLDAFEW